MEYGLPWTIKIQPPGIAFICMSAACVKLKTTNYEYWIKTLASNRQQQVSHKKKKKYQSAYECPIYVEKYQKWPSKYKGSPSLF